jgi:predicted dehydrogenase
MKVNLIGAGRMGLRHAAAVRQLGWSVVGVADVNTDAVAHVAADYGLSPAACFADASTMLREAPADFVIVATTAPSHCHLTCLAAETGAAYIVCEKPMAVSLGECGRMREVCERHRAVLAVNHPMRFMEQYVTPKALLDSEDFGGVTSISVVAGNFGMAMNATHYFEMFRFMTGERPHEVTAWFDDTAVPNPRGSQFSDRSGQVRVTTAGGRRLTLDAGADQGHGLRVVYGARYGQIAVDELAGTVHMTARRPEDRPLPTTRYAMPSLDSTRTIAPADVLAATCAVLRATAAGLGFPTGEDGELAVATLVAAYESDQAGHTAVRVGSGAFRDREFPWA